VHDRARPVPLTEDSPLYFKALAVRLQHIVHDQAIQLAEAQARLAVADRAALEQGLPAVEGELRAALGVPDDYRFNWQTLAFEPPAVPAPPVDR